MSFKKNILANYASQIYVTVIAVIMVPMYIKYMGLEAYGLVGFFAMLQAWFQLLDMGLTPTMARETACYQGGATDTLSYRRLLRAMKIIFVLVGVLGGVVMIMSAGAIAERWLNVKALPVGQVQAVLQLIAVSVVLRWMSGLYRACISGAERLVWLGGFNAMIATLRFAGVLPVLILVGHSPWDFFSYQLIIAVLELAGLAYKSHGVVPALMPGQKLGWTPKTLIAPIRPVLKFSLSMAFASLFWILISQTDKLILSKLLPLSEYGFFTFAVVAASGVLMVSGPVSGALMPRMAKLQAHGRKVELIALYRNATQTVAAIAIPVCLTLAFFAEQVLWLWTGDRVAAKLAAPTLSLYALGNGFLAISAFPYYLQFAKGDLIMHLRGNAIFILALVPSLIWAINKYGVVGAGYAWLASNALYFLAWLPLVHRRFEKSLHLKWLFFDITPTIVGGCGLIGLIHNFQPLLQGRLQTLGFIGATTIILISFSLILKQFIKYFINKQCKNG